MTKLKLGPIPDDKPVRLTVELPAELHRDLIAYDDILGREAGQGPIEPKKLVVPMFERFIATDRGFAKARRAPRGTTKAPLGRGEALLAPPFLSNKIITRLFLARLEPFYR